MKQTRRKRGLNDLNWISPIAKKIHFIWIGTNPLPDYFQLFFQRFKTLNPEFTFKMWKNKDLTLQNFPITYPYIKIIKKMHGKHIKDSPSAPTWLNSKGEAMVYSKWAQITDLMRLEIVFRYSGYYFDTTYECLKPLYGLFNRKETFVGCNESSRPLHTLPYLSNSFFGATKGNPILKRLLSKKSLGNIDFYWFKVNETTGPYYLRSGIQKGDNYHLFPSKYFYPFIEFPVQGRSVSTNKCHSHKRSNLTPKKNKGRNKGRSKGRNKGSKVIHLQQKKGYIHFPCDKYPKSYVLKHWQLGKSWVKK